MGKIAHTFLTKKMKMSLFSPSEFEKLILKKCIFEISPSHINTSYEKPVISAETFIGFHHVASLKR